MYYSLARYEELLSLLKEQGYRFCAFDEQLPSDEGGVVYLRHDIDFSPGIAVQFAEANRRLGAVGTFCFQLRSPIYNLLSAWTLDKIQRIQALGQEIGLHYVIPPELPEDNEQLAQMVLSDFEIVRQHVPGLVPVFSWHNPSKMPGLIENGWRFEVPGLVNAYGQHFFREIAYFSDSDLRYSVEEFREIIRRGYPRMQLLFHPFEWVCGGKTMINVISLAWRQIIREREVEVMNNKVYRKHFPQGMPAEILDRFAQSIVKEGLRRNGRS